MANPTIEQVASVPIFSRLSPDDQALVAAAADVTSFESGARVFVEGEPANVILALLSGSVRVVASSGRHDLPDVLHPGDPLGDVGAFEGGPYPATGTALEFTFDETTGRQTIELLGSKELLRFKLTLVRGGNLPEAEIGWVLFRVVQLVWFESVAG